MKQFRWKPYLLTAALAAAGAVVFAVAFVNAPSASAAPTPCYGSYVTGYYEDFAASCWESTYGPGGVVPQALNEAKGRCGSVNVCNISMDWSTYCMEEANCDWYSRGRMHYGCEWLDP